MSTPTAPTTPTAPGHQAHQARQHHAGGHVPYPWDEITPLDDEPGSAWNEIAGLAVGWLVFQVLLFCLAFTLGVMTGISVSQ